MASILLLFFMRLVPVSPRTEAVLQTVDTIVLFLFLAEFLIRFGLFGWSYFLQEFGWVDLLACVPLLAPLVEMTGQFRSLRLARIIRLLRIIRVMRLLRRIDDSESPHLQMKTRFFLGVSSVSMLFLLGTAVGITVLVQRFVPADVGVDQTALLDRIELVIMSAAVLASIAITMTTNYFLAKLVTDRVARINEYLVSVIMKGNKLPFRPDDMGDEISELGENVGRVASVFFL